MFLFGAGGGRQGHLHGVQEGVDLALQGGHVLGADRVRMFVAEQGQHGIFQSFAQAQQARQLAPVQLLGEVVQGQRELDEALEAALLAVFLPARLQRAQAGVERALLGTLEDGGFAFHGLAGIMGKGLGMGNGELSPDSNN